MKISKKIHCRTVSLTTKKNHRSGDSFKLATSERTLTWTSACSKRNWSFWASRGRTRSWGRESTTSSRAFFAPVTSLWRVWGGSCCCCWWTCWRTWRSVGCWIALRGEHAICYYLQLKVSKVCLKGQERNTKL